MTKKSYQALTIVFLFFLVLLVVVPCAKALDKKAELAVYHKFYKATNAESQYNQILNIMVAQFQQGFVVGFRDAAKKLENATPEEQQKFRQLFEKGMESYTQKMRKKAAEVMPLNELIDNVYYPTLSKHFTVSEIEELIKFYESPVGQKYISVAPTVMQESSVLINQKYIPQLQKISTKVAEEEMKKIKPELEKLQQK
jgi:hypothetical protein